MLYLITYIAFINYAQCSRLADYITYRSTNTKKAWELLLFLNRGSGLPNKCNKQ